MDNIENYLLQCYGLKTIREYSIGSRMRLLSLQGTYCMRNTAIDSVDLKGLHDYLMDVGRIEQQLDVRWAIVKTVSPCKDSVLVSLRKTGLEQSSSLRDVLTGKEPKLEGQKKSGSTNPFEWALSESLQKLGISNCVALSE